uniref:Uncharacterized protein n=1 Tax=Lotharella vacuolata TaxID=74820 RepID=A0A0H5BKE3_9EUKA|nr:hypothetical protein [Lotharella vacuolata]
MFELNEIKDKSLIEYKTKILKINVKDSLTLHEQLIYSKFYYFNIISKLGNFDLYFQSNKLLLLCCIQLGKNFFKKILILFKNIIINGLFQKIEYSKQNINIFLIQLPVLEYKKIEKTIIQLIETKMLYFVSFLLQYSKINYNPIVLIKSHFKKNNFKIILRCRYLNTFLKKILKFSNIKEILYYYSKILYYVYFLSHKRMFYLYKNIENYYKINYFF